MEIYRTSGESTYGPYSPTNAFGEIGWTYRCLRSEGKKMTESLGEAMYRIRKAKGMTIAGIALKTGGTECGIRRWETGERLPMTRKLRQWVSVMNLSKAELAQIAVAALIGPEGGRHKREHGLPQDRPTAFELTKLGPLIWIHKVNGSTIHHLYNLDETKSAACGLRRPLDGEVKDEPSIDDRCYSCEKIRRGIPRNTKVGDLGW